MSRGRWRAGRATGGCGQCGLCVARSRKTEWEVGGWGEADWEVPPGIGLQSASCSPRPFPGPGQQLFSSPPPSPGLGPRSPLRTAAGESVGRGDCHFRTSGRGRGWPGAFICISLPRARPLCSRRGGRRGRGHCLGERVGGAGLGEGRVKGPLPAGLLTPWCPAGPFGGKGEVVPTPLPTCPRNLERSGEGRLSWPAEAGGDPVPRPESQAWKLRP